MKKVLVFCVLLALAVSLDGSGAWAIDVGWMQKGVRVWYMGQAGSADADETFLFTSIDGNNAQLIHHSAVTNWTLPNQADPETGSILDKGPCWIHPQVLQTLESGDVWQGHEIVTVLPDSYTYDSLRNELSAFPYLLLPIKALFVLNPQRNLVKIVYMIAGSSTGIAYFDADTGLLLLRENSTGYVTVWFMLSEINYDFATHRAFAEDNGPHTGFKSNVIKTSSMGQYIMIQSSVETRYGDTVQMWVSISAGGSAPYLPANENYCFFGSVPVLRHKLMTATPQYPPENWNQYGEYLWWWVPTDALQKSTIDVFGVDMTRTSTAPYTFEANVGTGLYFSKMIFDNDGYMTDFAVKYSAYGLNIGLGTYAPQPIHLVDGLDYYKNTMGIATPDTLVYAYFGASGIFKWNGSAWSQLNGISPTKMVASGSTLYVSGLAGGPGIWKWDGTTWSHLNGIDPANMVASGSNLYADLGAGIWKWDGVAWSHLNGISPANMVASGSTLYLSGLAGGPGIWKWDGTAWSHLNGINPANMVASDSTLYVSGLAGGAGIWKWDGVAWSHLNGIDPANMVASGSTLYLSGLAGGAGIWKWDGTTWSHLNGIDPAKMVASGSTLYVSGLAGGAGIWKWDGTTWSHLNGIDPANMVAN